VTCADDVIDSLSLLISHDTFKNEAEQPDLLTQIDEAPGPLQAITTDEQRDIRVDALGLVLIDFDTLVRHIGIDASNAQLILLELDFAGKPLRSPRDQVAFLPRNEHFKLN
jgi:DNA processing protein